MSNQSKLSDLINLIGGGTPKRSVQEYWNGNIPWLSVKDFNNTNRYVETSAEKISELGLKNSSTNRKCFVLLIPICQGLVSWQLAHCFVCCQNR